VDISQQQGNEMFAIAAESVGAGASGGLEAAFVEFDAQVVGFGTHAVGQQGIPLANGIVNCAGVVVFAPTLETLVAGVGTDSRFG